MNVSVIVPTRNRPASCARLLKALAAQVDDCECGKNVEVIIIDDHSSLPLRDQLAAYVSASARCRIHLVSRESAGGPSAARNSGIARASGDVLAFLDDDCVPGPDFLSEIVRLHSKYPSILLINGNLRALGSDSISRFWFHYYNHAFNCGEGEIYRIERISSGNFSIKRSLLGSFDPLFDETLASREDFDLYLRLRHAGIPVFKADSIHADIECRRTVRELLAQRAWYECGESDLRRKYGADYLKQIQAGRYPRPSPSFIHIYLILYIARKLRAFRQMVQR